MAQCCGSHYWAGEGARAGEGAQPGGIHYALDLASLLPSSALQVLDDPAAHLTVTPHL